MGDSKSTKLVSFAKSGLKIFPSEEDKEIHRGDFLSSSQQEQEEESLISTDSKKRFRKKSRKEKKKLVDEAPSQKKKTKGGVTVPPPPPSSPPPPPEETLETPLTQKQKEFDRKLSITEKIKAFARKGAAAKFALQEKKPVDQTTKDLQEAIRRRGKSSVIETIIRPAEEDLTETRTSEHSSITTSERSVPAKPEKREAELMQEKLLKDEQGDQALANLVLDLLKRKRKEKEEAQEIVLTESQIFEKSKNMSALEQTGIICVLEETIAKLSVLGFTHGKPVLIPEIEYVSLLDKLASKEDSALIDLIKSNKTPEEHETEKYFIKLQKDRGFLEEALTLTLLEMKQKGTFGILQDIVHLEEEMVKEEIDLRFEGKKVQQEVNHCKALLESEHKRGIKRLDDRTAILAKLKDEIQNVIYYNGLKFKYMDHWESSRAEQNIMLLQKKEKEMDRKLLDYEEMTNIELRCNAEMKAFIEENIKNLTQMVEEWMEKYEKELEEREYKISKLKEEREDHLKTLLETRDLYNERQKKIDDWKAYKEQKRIEAEHLDYLNRKATRIQAWWRGVMVRRHLGPYKKKKGKHGKKGKKKKKK